MSEMSKEQDGELRELCDDLKRWQGYYDPVDDKGQHEMFVSAADAVTELLALRKEREAAVPVAESGHVRREVHVGGNTWVQCSAQAYERAKAEGKITRELYERPTQPVAVPDAMPETVSEDGNDIDYMEPSAVYELGKTHGWNACRAAMLAAPGKPVAAGWIACSERMPELDTRVLLYFPDYGGHIEDGCIGDEGDGHYHYFFDGDSLRHEPTHWMPLPEAPGKEG